MRFLILLTAFCFLGACQHSPQKRYYVLGPVSSQTTITSSDQQAHILVGIGPIEVADYLKRPSMVRMRTNNTLNLTTNDYWAEPLDKGIVRVLALNLTQRNPSRVIQTFPWRRDSAPVYSLRLQIHDLLLTDNKATINATWELVNSDSKENILRQHFIRHIDAGTSAKAMAEAYSQLLAQLADAMDNALKAAETTNQAQQKIEND